MDGADVLLATEAAIRAEADRLVLDLLPILSDYGEVHVTGSYALRLMIWRDLDIHLVREPLEVEPFFALGGTLAALLSPHRMHYRDETIVRTPGLPKGLYWGVYLGDERQGAWKIDIWASEREAFEPPRTFCERIQNRLTDASRQTILRIKSACWQHPEYRRSFSSADIYEAVLDHGVEEVDQFRGYLNRRRG